MEVILRKNSIKKLTTYINVVFNCGMSKSEKIRQDKELINLLGGPAKLAKLLNFEKSGSVQRIFNWTVRGIPPAIKLEYQKIFLVKNTKK